MFDDDVAGGINFSERRVKRAESPLPHEEESRQVRRRRDRKDGVDLDSLPMLDLHGRLMGLYRRELDRQSDNRVDQAIDEDFYDNIQWTEEDAQTLRDRGQLPLVYNVISSSLNWVLGTEKRSRMDYKILPRRKDDAKPAERKTALMKYLSDVNRTPFSRSRAFADAVKVGIGWMECGVEDSDTGDPVYSRYENWRNMLWDSTGIQPDLTDARYVYRSKWVDADILASFFPNRKVIIKESIDESAGFAMGADLDGDDVMDSREQGANEGLHTDYESYERPRVRAIECWFRKPTQVHKLIGGMFGGDIYDFSDAHDDEIRSGRATIAKKTTMRVYVAIMTHRGLLYFGPSPYRHNRFPFTPVWGNRRGRDGMPYGMIRGLRDIQSDINKRASKALHILSSNKVLMDEDALPEDWTMEEFEEEVAQTQAILVKRRGSEMKLDVDRELAPAHLELMSRSIAMIQQQSGITDELLGRRTNATSGVAIQSRQEQGSAATTTLFDNLRFAAQVHGEKELSLIEQFFTENKSFRITNARGTPDYVEINTGLPEDDITRTKADFVISEADWNATMRMASAQALLETLKVLGPVAPQVAVAMIDLVVENMDLPNREEIVKRIRAATGMMDPDADENSPENQAAMQAKAQAQQMQMEAAMADLQEKQAKAALTQAKAEETVARARKVVIDARKTLMDVAGAGVEAQAKAINAALDLLSVPDAAPVADQMLRESGFKAEPERNAEAQQLLSMLDQAAQHEGQAPGMGAMPPEGGSPAGGLPA